MPKIRYRSKRFSLGSKAIIAQANVIIEEYVALGFELTLRQLYYQFVARGYIDNKDTEYKRLGSIINDARMAGMIDWDRIVDRTRFLRALSHWDSPADVVRSASYSYRNDLWADQPEYVEVWIEKDALVGVIENACNGLDVPFFSCRGYTSQSEMWGASQRLRSKVEEGKKVWILHLGDHDPSGIDMSRDIEERLWYFIGTDLYQAAVDGVSETLDDEDHQKIMKTMTDRTSEHFHLTRLALNMDQVREHEPPPNPAKITDSRARGYIREHGPESWELDALDPTLLSGLIRDSIEEHMDPDLMFEARQRQTESRQVLEEASRRWEDVAEFLEGSGE